MAVVNTTSTAITNGDAQPPVLNSSWFEKGSDFESVATVEVAAADSDGSVYRMVRVPSNARIASLRAFSDAITGGTSYSLGVYDTAANGGAVVSKSLFGSAVDLSSGVSDKELAFQNLDIANIEKRLWEVLGLSADSGKDYDICLTGDTVGTAAGTISLKAKYVL